MASPSSQTSFSAKFVVKCCVSELVVPAKPTLNEVKNLSDIDDQKGSRGYFPMIWFYRKNDKKPSMELEEKEKDPVKVIKEAVGRAMVYYYPLAGRLKEGPDGKLLVDCNGEGVLFIEADADVSFEQLGHPIQPPFPYVDEILSNFPCYDSVLGRPLLLIQVIRMSCGGFILAINFNHVMFDGFGLSQFLNTCGEIAKGVEKPSIQPVWQRELLNARNPPRITQIHHEYLPEATDIDHPNFHQSEAINRSFFFGPNQIMAIQNHLRPHLANTCTRFELLTACVWKCRTLALNMDPKEDVQVSCVFNGRHKNMINDLSLLLGYYGNVISFSAAVSKAGVLCEKPLGYAMELVKTAKSKMNAEYIRSVADLMVIKRRPGDKLKGNFIVSDITRLVLEDVDFGWGLPEYAGPPMTSTYFGYNIKYKSKGEDGILVLICLPLSVMERFQQELTKIITIPRGT
nr:alcohol acyl transferase 2-like [Ziziphus jujuba var. spinosa]